MGDAYMEIGDRELEKIGQYVQSHLDEWNRNTILNFQSSRELEMTERTIRLEEGLKNSIDLMRQGFDMMDKRFEDMQANMDRRFEQVDKRFEDMQHYMDKRFNTLQWAMGIGFTVIAALMGIFNFF